MLFPPRIITATYRAHQLKSIGVSNAQFQQLIIGAEIWEQDARGPKVYRLANGHILKLFRRKHKVSSAALTSYARHFCYNAETLHTLGVPSVEIINLLHFEENKDTGVIYRPLPGKTIRQLMKDGATDQMLMKKLGSFVAHLHDKGVLFRSLHFGNVVVTADGELGLIDVGDLKIYPYALNLWKRLRNFKHFQRVREDWKDITAEEWTLLLEGYFAATKLASVSATVLSRLLDRRYKRRS